VFITAYFPNGSRDHSRVPFKMAYKAAFLDYCNNLRKQGKAVIFCGDVNTAHNDIDLARPKDNTKTTGFLPEERVWIDQAIEAGYIDIFRDLNPNLEGAYNWWSPRSGAREKNIGWRIDYFFITPDLKDRVVTAEIHPNILGSDHCPISLTLK
jgi:exodeoxyribonuclease-3